VHVEQIRLVDGREVDVARWGAFGARPVLYFHSPATSGEELEGAAESAAAALDIEMLVIVRRSVAGPDDPRDFMAAVASNAAQIVEALGLESVDILGWSGGAPYALAAANRLRSAVATVHLVSPVPGPLSGPDAVDVRSQSQRLREIAETSPSSSWAAAPGTLRDYLGLVAPWPFDVRSVVSPVTIWAPSNDEIVPPQLVEHLSLRLPHAETVNVSGSHNWITEHWPTVLRRMAAV